MAVIKKIIFSDNSNRVGIGTTTPTATLDVSGSAFVTGSISSTGDIYGNTVTAGTTYTTRISGAGAGAWIYFGVAGSNALGTIGRFGSLMQFDSDTPFSFKINGGEKFRIDTNGSVGIGTTANIDSILTVNANSGNVTNSGGLTLLGTNPNYGARFTVYDTGTGIQGQISLKIAGSYNTPSIVIGGNAGGASVGIAKTSAPNATLDVNGNAIITGSLTSNGDIYANGTNGLVLYSADPTNYNISRSGGDLIFKGSAIVTVRAGGTGANNAEIAYSNLPALYFKTANSTRMTIDANGNVGIGTTAPTSLFTIQGSQSEIHVKHDATRAITIGNWDGTAQYIKSINLGVALTPFVLQASRFTFDTGNVGIGVSSPNAKLHITGSAIIDTVGGNSSLTISNSNPSGYSVLNLKNTGGTAQSYHLSVGGSAVGGLAQSFYIYDETNNATRFYVKSDGNIGIGTTNPQRRIDVLGGDIMVRSTSNTGTSAVNFGSTDYYPRASIRSTGLASPVGDANLSFWTRTGGNEYERITILNDGNVGIGTTTPLTILNLSGGGGAVYQTFTDTTNAYHHGYVGKNGGGLVFGFSSQNGSFSADEKMRVTTSGNVGIGTSSPSYKLHVIGDARMGANGQRLYFYDDGNAHIHSTSTPLWLNSEDNSNIYINHQYNGGVILTKFGGGNVGIGEGSPSQKLHVSGSVRITGGIYDSSNSIGTNGQVLTSTGTGLSWSSAGSGTISGTGTANYVARFSTSTNITTGSIYDNGTNVGIGTTSPSARLTISGSAGDGTPSLRIITTGAASTYNWAGSMMHAELGASKNYILLIGQSESTKNSGYIGFNHSGTSGSDTNFLTFGMYGNNNLMNIKGDGNVGIGTTSPTQKLYISTGGSNGGIVVDTGAGSTSAFIRLINSNQNWDVNTQTNNRFAIYDQTNSKQPFTIEPNTPSNTVWLAATGNVGIGTTTPTAKLEVNGSISLTGDIRNAWGDRTFAVTQYPDNYGTSPSYYMGFKTDATTRQFYIDNKNNDGAATDPNGGIIFRTGTTPTSRMIVSYGGNIGIGTTSPADLLNIQGTNKNIRVTNTAAYNASGTAYLGFNGYYNSSNADSWFARIVSGKENTTDNDARGYLSIQTNNPSSGIADRVRIDSNGSVGIGTSSPSQLVEASKSQDGDTAIQVTNSSTGTAATAQFFASNGTTRTQFYHTGTSYGTVGAITANQGGIYNGTSAGLAIVATNASSVIKFATGGTTEKMRLDANGNLGIGTTSPGFKLDVDRSSTGTVAAFRGSGITTGNQINVLIGKSDSTYNTSTIIWRHAGGDGSTSNYLGIGVWDNDYILNVVANGRVGIGTTTPAYKLDVSGSVRTGDTTLYSAAGTNPKMFFSSSVGSSSIRLEVVPDGGLSFIGSNGQLFGISDSLSGSLMNVSDISGLPIFEVFSDDKVVMGKYGTNALVVTGSSVGIGKNNPSAKLDVSGSVFVTGSIYSTGNLYLGGSSNVVSIYDGAGTRRFLNDSVYNVAIGQGSLASNISGPLNVVIGYNSGNKITTAGYNVGIGWGALENTSIGEYNTALGNNAMRINKSGSYNVAVGNTSLWFNDGGSQNVAIGASALFFNVTGSYNVALGASALANVTSSYNVGLGNNAGYTLTGGKYNTIVGSYATTDLGITTGNYNTIIGSQVSGLSATLSNTIIIADGQGNQRIYVKSDGNVGIGTTSPGYKLDVNGDARVNSATGLTITGWNTDTGLRLNYGNAGGQVTAINLIANGTTNGFIGMQMVDSSNGDLWLGGSGGRSLTIYRNNNVGIGTNSPNAKLDVNGNVIITGSLTVTAPITASTLTVTNLNVSTISSSVVYSSGSNVFGNTTSNKQQFTGSVQINGTLTTNDAVETTDVFGLKSFTKSLTVTTSWSDTGISGTDLATGTYILQLLVDNSDVSGGQVTEYYSGTMSWFSGATNSTEFDEIVLHKAGSNPGGNWINLRTLRQSSSSVLKLQIISNVNTTGADNYIFKFRRLI